MKLTGRAAAVWFAVILRLVVASGASAQGGSASLRVGDRVRLTTAASPRSPVTGLIVSSDDSQLTIDIARAGAAPAERTFDWNSLTRIERSGGYKSNVGKGAWIGAGLGILVGAGVFFVSMDEIGEGPVPLTAPLWYGAIGTLVGAALGAASSGERWSALPSDARVGMQFGSRSAPLAVGIRVSF